jgi:hypothetical protein
VIVDRLENAGLYEPVLTLAAREPGLVHEVVIKIAV